MPYNTSRQTNPTKTQLKMAKPQCLTFSTVSFASFPRLKARVSTSVESDPAANNREA